jgi:hypothetical protein
MTPQLPLLLNVIPRKGNALCVENGTPRNIRVYQVLAIPSPGPELFLWEKGKKTLVFSSLPHFGTNFLGTFSD